MDIEKIKKLTPSELVQYCFSLENVDEDGWEEVKREEDGYFREGSKFTIYYHDVEWERDGYRLSYTLHEHSEDWGDDEIHNEFLEPIIKEEKTFKNMTNEEFRKALEKSWDYFIQHNGTARVYEGWKLSIQGKGIDDAVYLYEHLVPFLLISKASFKFGTQRLYTCDNEEQKTKVLTVYIPDGVDAKSFAELCYLHIKDYEGGEDIPAKVSYTHYKNAIYYRNDRTEDGQYIPAKPE